MKLTEAARVFKALSSEQRLKVLQLIRTMSSTEGCAGATKAFTRCCAELELSRSTVSHHLKELETAGIITTARKGQAVCCQVNEKLWSRLISFLK